MTASYRLLPLTVLLIPFHRLFELITLNLGLTYKERERERERERLTIINNIIFSTYLEVIDCKYCPTAMTDPDMMSGLASVSDPV